MRLEQFSRRWGSCRGSSTAAPTPRPSCVKFLDMPWEGERGFTPAQTPGGGELWAPGPASPWGWAPRGCCRLSS